MSTVDQQADRDSPLRVLLFSGGRGSDVLTRQLLANARVALTIAINGYDDGASTGAVRRLLGDSLGPSDFRKNASRVAGVLRSCAPELVELLDLRFPPETTRETAADVFEALRREPAGDGFVARVRGLAVALSPEIREALICRLDLLAAVIAAAAEFDFGDCSLGNLVFAGGFLRCSRDFNRAVDDYCALLGVPAGLIENVTDGTNLWLVGIDDTGRVLESEEAIVGMEARHGIRDIFLLAAPLTAEELAACTAEPASAPALLDRRSSIARLNPRLRAAIDKADLIIYAPGTQHSSLFPSYLTRGLAPAIASNLRAMKLLLTNIQPDAEIAGTNAVDIIERAVFYLKEKEALTTPTPCLITHYLVNDPGRHEPERVYVPLGELEAIEDPRLVRIANYEDGVSGRHNASRVLAPFLATLGHRGARKRAAILLYEGQSPNKIVQTLLEMVRGDLERVPLQVEVYYDGAPLDAAFAASLPFRVTRLTRGAADFSNVLRDGAIDFAILFESSGMYRGEDVVAVASHLAVGRFDAVWGSRRLSVRDIEESYRLRYRRTPLIGAISYGGSHLLSVAYLLLYGRYIADTLSGVRGVSALDVANAGDLTSKQANHLLLTSLLGRKADVLEVPVQFLPLSPERVQRTTVMDGLRALGTIVKKRVWR